MEEHLIIGGAGYPGMSLATTIASSGVHVKVFDVMQPSRLLPANITFVQVFTLFPVCSRITENLHIILTHWLRQV